MAQVKATAHRDIPAKPDVVLAVLADYRQQRPKMLTEHFSEYEVRAGGVGSGTVVHWKLRATEKRIRDCLFSVSETGTKQLVEDDANSSMVTTWTVLESNEGSAVIVETTWNGAGGIGGFFERTFAPLGMRKIYDQQLEKLAELV